MKIVNMLKKVLIDIGVVLLVIPTKAYASVLKVGQVLYGPINPIETLYGPPPEDKTTILKRLLMIGKGLLIPVVLAIGLIVYSKKSKSSARVKSLVTLGVIIIALIIYYLIVR